MEPDPHRWLNQALRQQLMKELCSARPLLRQSGLWRASLGYWVRRQVSFEVCWEKREEEQLLDDLLRKWRAQHPSSADLDENTLRAKLRVAPAAARWSRQQWGHRLDSLFLKCKDQLDRASCRLLRLSDKPLATELYHRIKAKETSFERAARDFGEGPERHQGGLIHLQPLGSMPFGLAPVLSHLKPGLLSQPLRLGKGFCLVELVEFQASQLDEPTGDALLAEQLRLWIDSVVDVVEAELRWPDELKLESPLEGEHHIRMAEESQ